MAVHNINFSNSLNFIILTTADVCNGKNVKDKTFRESKSVFVQKY